MIDLFRLVLVVDQFRNFNKAARALGMTQSTLSRRIQTFEEELGFACSTGPGGWSRLNTAVWFCLAGAGLWPTLTS